MPKVYSTEEKEDIKQRLKDAVKKSLSINGIRKTTVDYLVEDVHIPKGTFYLFYKSKEILIFEVLLEVHEVFEQDMKIALSQIDIPHITVDQLTDFLFTFFIKAKENPMFQMLTSGERELLSQKLPPEILEAHFSQDDDMLEAILTFMPHPDNVDIRLLSAAFRDLFMFMFSNMYQSDESLKLLIRGLVLQFITQ